MLPHIVLLGRPNVGKSTLFNRITGRNRAITHGRPGVTRDRMVGLARRLGRRFMVVDTGGISLDRSGAPGEGPKGIRGFEAEILTQARQGIDEAHAILLVLDGRDGLLPLDEQLAAFARQSGKPVIAVVNKVDGAEQEDRLAPEFHALGLDLVPVSAAHGYNMQTLLEAVVALLPEPAPDEEAPEESLEEAPEEPLEETSEETDEELVLEGEDQDQGEDWDLGEAWEGDEAEDEVLEQEELAPGQGLRLAMLGRPNAGKSSLINRFAGRERMIVSEIPGTTRDSVDVVIQGKDGREYTFVDTAGVRRRTKITDTVERFSVHAALVSSQKAQVTVFVMDAVEGVTAQDKRLIALLDKEKTPFVAVVNKMDLVQGDMREPVRKAFQAALKICGHVPLLFVSARTGQGVSRILDQALALWSECGIRVPTGQLNRAMTEVLTKHQPPVVKGRRAKFYYMTQTGVRPPTFVMFVNDPERVKPSYAKYLENRLRALFGIDSAPIKLHLRESGPDDSRRRGGKARGRPKPKPASLATTRPPAKSSSACGDKPGRKGDQGAACTRKGKPTRPRKATGKAPGKASGKTTGRKRGRP